jgi:RNA polymerase sigma factor (sigma-70 family)
MFSELIGGENGYENFHEFASSDEDPQLITINSETTNELNHALSKLTKEEIVLLRDFFMSGRSERRVAAEYGISHMTLRYRKEKILDKLRRIMSGK